MDVYRRKSRLKLVLLLLGSLIAVITVLYTNHLASKISGDEKSKVKLWAEAVENKAEIVKYTNELFQQLETDERKKVQEWADATKLVISVTDNSALTFLTNLISNNDNIPLILTDDSLHIQNFRNVDVAGMEDSFLLKGQLYTDFNKYPPIEIDFQLGDAHIRNYIFYQDSKLFRQLRANLNKLVESFIDEIVVNSASVPVMLTNQAGIVESFGNIDSNVVNNPDKLQKKLTEMLKNGKSLKIDLGEGNIKYLYYEDSPLLTQLTYFPYVQLVIIGIFLLAAYVAFSAARRAEENHVWIGMAKETAHQLGTPLSSLNSWVDFIRTTPYEERKQLDIMNEVQKDLNRLNLIAERFSKIGSKPQLTAHSALIILEDEVDYFKRRSSEKVKFHVQVQPSDLSLKINRELFQWVLENLFKNALDAMEGEGDLSLSAYESKGFAFIEIRDSGKGIPATLHSSIFQPGYTTKQRGWGLGLSLSKRIIENYHHGKIFVKESNSSGTTFAIKIPQ